MCWQDWGELKSTWNSSFRDSSSNSCIEYLFFLPFSFLRPKSKIQKIPKPKGSSYCKSSLEREGERESKGEKSSLYPYDGGGYGLLLDRESQLERRGFWFRFKEMRLRLDHHLWWRWWSEEEPRRLGHGSSESRGNGSSVRADFPHLESSPPPPEAFAAWVQFKPWGLLRCCFSGFVASLFLFLLLL